MPSYASVSNGYASAELTEGDLQAIFRKLKYLNTDALINSELLHNGDITMEVMSLTGRLTGGFFEDWVHANFNEGKGPLKHLVRTLISYMNGKVGIHALTTQISIEENKLQGRFKRGDLHHTTHTHSVPIRKEALLIDDDQLCDFDYYRLLEGVGPVVVLRIFLLLGGESYYGN